MQALRSLHQVKSFIASPVMLLLFDAPLAPLYFAAIFLIHPDLGWIALICGLLLIVIALLNQRATRQPLAEAGLSASKADAHAEALTRNSQVVNAMGMLKRKHPALGPRAKPRTRAARRGARPQCLDQRRLEVHAAGRADHHPRRRCLSCDPWQRHRRHDDRGLDHCRRALQPFEMMIEGWRNLMQARSAYARVRATVESLKQERERLLLPKPEGQLTVDKLLYLSPSSREAILNGISFQLNRASCLPLSAPPVPASRRWRGFSSVASIRPRAACGSTRPSCATGTAGSSANSPATCRRRSSYFPAASRRTCAGCTPTCPTRRSTKPRNSPTCTR